MERETMMLKNSVILWKTNGAEAQAYGRFVEYLQKSASIKNDVYLLIGKAGYKTGFPGICRESRRYNSEAGSDFSASLTSPR
jgi:hypothetical protein